jgi:hypothetical protein
LALKGDDPPVVVIGELKLTFNLELVLQGVDRAAACDEVWLAARRSSRGKGRESDARFRNLCRRLGFGLLGVSLDGEVEVLLTPDAPTPRKNRLRRSRLLEEHRRRRGDPVEGGGSRAPIMTALPTARPRLRRRVGAGSATPPRPQAVDPGRSQDSSRECLWLVRPRRARSVRSDRIGSGRALALATAGHCLFPNARRSVIFLQRWRRRLRSTALSRRRQFRK